MKTTNVSTFKEEYVYVFTHGFSEESHIILCATGRNNFPSLLFQVSFNTALTVLLVADGALARQQRLDCPASYENSGHQRSSCQTMPTHPSACDLLQFLTI